MSFNSIFLVKRIPSHLFREYFWFFSNYSWFNVCFWSDWSSPCRSCKVITLELFRIIFFFIDTLKCPQKIICFRVFLTLIHIRINNKRFSRIRLSPIFIMRRSKLFRTPILANPFIIDNRQRNIINISRLINNLKF